MSLNKNFLHKYNFPISVSDISYYSFKSSSLIHLKIKTKTRNHISFCGTSLKKANRCTKPSIIADVCLRCQKNRYLVAEQSKLWQADDWVDLINELVLGISDNEIKKLIPNKFDRSNIYTIKSQKRFEYRILSKKIHDEIKKCNHIYLLYLMRYNKILSLKCHNCLEEIQPKECDCDEPITIDFVDLTKNGEELGRDHFCMLCKGYVIANTQKYI